MNVVLVGGGGREHALAAKLAASERLGTLFVTNPENPGLARLGKPVDVPVSIREIYRLAQFCDKEKVGLVVVGPEEPLAEGFADKLAAPGRLVFGPRAQAAQLEADKAWAKKLMRDAAIPTAESRTFTDPEAAMSFLKSREQPQVIKAAGLAKGKGVVVPETMVQAMDAVQQMMVKRVYGDAGRTVVIEERMEGPEVSVLALVDGSSVLVMPPCQDHKRLRDNDEGPNTGGMGAFCPSGLVDAALMSRIEREILVPTVDALRREEIDFKGVLYAGLMLTHAGPKVLEFNVRFGDPECQPLMATLDSDLLELMLATCQGRLDQIDVNWKTGAACCVVLAADGYPENPRKGAPISGVEEAERTPGVSVYHAGTRLDDHGRLVTNGGRVLAVTATGATLADARDRAYAACDLIRFDGKQIRTDIGVPRERARQPRTNRWQQR